MYFHFKLIIACCRHSSVFQNYCYIGFKHHLICRSYFIRNTDQRQDLYVVNSFCWDLFATVKVIVKHCLVSMEDGCRQPENLCVTVDILMSSL